MTLPPTPKNQHYVWQHYLQAWETGGTIACYRQRERKAFRPGTKNVAAETYFYRVHDLTDGELAYLEATIAARPVAAMRDNHRSLVETFRIASKLRRLVEATSTDPESRSRSLELLDQADRRMGESYQVAVEAKGMPFLASLRAGDATFWADQRAACDFSYFIATQYMRTARMRNAVTAAYARFSIDIARVWSIESHFWASEIGAALFARSKCLRAVLLSNASGVPFITGDQPAINLAPTAPLMKLYYPVAPYRALLLTGEPAEQDRMVSAIEVETLNHAMYSWSDDQLYGLDKEYLVQLAQLAKSPTL